MAHVLVGVPLLQGQLPELRRVVWGLALGLLHRQLVRLRPEFGHLLREPRYEGLVVGMLLVQLTQVLRLALSLVGLQIQT